MPWRAAGSKSVALLPGGVEIRRIEPSARTLRAAPAIRDR